MNSVSSVTTKGRQYQIEDEVAREEKLDIKDLPSKLSFFQNDVGFIDKTVGNLINYYKKAETYSREELNELLSKKLVFKVVQELPTEDISESTIYFVPRPRTEQEQGDYYNEYIYADSNWELIGNTFVDLSDYYLKEQTDEQIALKVAAEKAERVEAERALQENIDEVQADVDSVNAALDNERLRREQVDLLHSQSISALETNLGVEINRAENAESALSDRADAAETHIANKDNPHNVTKEQVGLGNVANIGTDSAPTYESENNVSSGGVFNALETKVDKIAGKGLSDQNFTYGEKTKLAGLSNYDDTALKNRVTATENAITTLNGNSSVAGSVDKKIADAIGGITQIDFQIVQTLPATGVKGVFYFVVDTLGEENIYNEYVWVNNDWELIGQTISKIDLSDYYKKSETNALVSVKNDKITVSNDTTALTDSDSFDETSAGTNPTSIKRRLLSSLWTYINSKISSVLGLTSSSYSGTSTYATNLGTSSANYTKSSLDTALSGKVATTRKVNGHALSADVTVTKSDVGLSNVDNTADSNKAVASAGKLTTARKVYVKLGTASTTETKDFSGDTAIPVNGTLGIANGGTGKTTAKGAEYNIIGGVEEVETAFDDNRFIAVKNQTVSDSNGVFRWFKISNLISYIKGKFSVTPSGSGNAITELSYSNGVFTVKKESTFTNLTVIAPSFSKSTTYAVGAFVTYNQLIYKCTTAHPAGAWNASHFTQVTVMASITKENVGLGNVGDFKAVSTVASQGLTDTEKSNARANIGAGTSSFSGSYNDLTNKPTIPSGVMVDSALSSTSTNPVQNKVINTALNDKAGTSTATQSANGLMSATDKKKLDGMGSTNGITFEIV